MLKSQPPLVSSKKTIGLCLAAYVKLVVAVVGVGAGRKNPKKLRSGTVQSLWNAACERAQDGLRRLYHVWQ